MFVATVSTVARELAPARCSRRTPCHHEHAKHARHRDVALDIPATKLAAFQRSFRMMLTERRCSDVGRGLLAAAPFASALSYVQTSEAVRVHDALQELQA